MLDPLLHFLLSLPFAFRSSPSLILSSPDLLLTNSYNGQRCTAIKIILVHESIADTFVAAYCNAVDALAMGLPFTDGVKITPLPGI